MERGGIQEAKRGASGGGPAPARCRQAAPHFNHGHQELLSLGCENTVIGPFAVSSVRTSIAHDRNPAPPCHSARHTSLAGRRHGRKRRRRMWCAGAAAGGIQQRFLRVRDQEQRPSSAATKLVTASDSDETSQPHSRNRPAQPTRATQGAAGQGPWATCTSVKPCKVHDEPLMCAFEVRCMLVPEPAA